MNRDGKNIETWIILLIFIFSYSPCRSAPTPIDQIRFDLDQAFYQDKNLKQTEKLLDKLDYSGSVSLEIIHNKYKSELLLEMGNFKGAIEIIENTIDKYPEFSSQEMAELWRSSASIDKMYGRVSRSISKAEKALALSQSFNLKDLELECLLLIGTGHISAGNLKLGIKNLERARVFPKTATNLPSHLALYNSLALVYLKRDKYKVAINQLLEGIKYFETLSSALKEVHFSRLIFYQLNLSKCFIEINNAERSQHYLDLAVAHPKISRIQKNKAFFIQGQIHIKNGHENEALKSFNQSLDLNKQINIPKQRVTLFNQIADLFIQKNKLKMAQAYVDSSLFVLANNPELSRNSYVDILKVDLLLKKGKYKEASELAKSNLVILEAIENPSYVLKINEQLLQAQQKLGNSKEANLILDRILALQDKKYNLDNYLLSNEIESQYRIEKKNKSINTIQLNNIALQSKIDKNNTVTLGLSILLFFLLSGIGIGYLFFKNQKTYALQQEKLAQEQLINLKTQSELELLNANLNGQEIERKKLSQNLNNQLGSQLATLQMELDQMQKTSPILAEALEEPQRLLDDACKEVRRISDNLMPGALANLGLKEALEDLSASIEKNSILNVHLSILSLPNQLDQGLAIFLYRCTEELINNCVKHAQAMNLIIQITYYEDEIRLTIEDDGNGFLPDDKTKGIGLRNLKTRVARYNGEFSIESSIARGSTFNIIVPHPEPKYTSQNIAS